MDKLEVDPLGKTEEVTVIMRGKVYKDDGLKASKHPNIEGILYDRLCLANRKLRDDVRHMASEIASSKDDEHFKATTAWLDDFMRRFCLTNKRRGNPNKVVPKIKGRRGQKTSETKMEDDVKEHCNEEKEILPTIAVSNGHGAVDNQRNLLSPRSDEAENIESLKDSSEPEEEKIKSKATSDSEGDESAKDKELQSVNISDDHEKEASPNNVEDQTDPISVITDTAMLEPIQEEMQTSDSDHDINCKANADESVSKSLECLTETNNGGTSTEENENEESLLDSNVINPDKSENNIETSINSVNTEKSKQAESEESDCQVIQTDDDSDIEHVEHEKEEASSPICPSTKDYNDGKVFINYSTSESKYYGIHSKRLNQEINETRNHCTACYDQVGHQSEAEVFTHPVLGVLICKKCYKFYGKGNFKKDEEGYDEYCRWCANGGDMLLCDSCKNVFCKKCVKRNLGRNAESEALNADEWECYVCSVKPLKELRALQRAILEQLNKSISTVDKHREKASKIKKFKKSRSFKRNDLVDSFIYTSIDELREMIELCSTTLDDMERKISSSSSATNLEEKSIRCLTKITNYVEGKCGLVRQNIKQHSVKEHNSDKLEDDKIGKSHSAPSKKSKAKRKERGHSLKIKVSSLLKKEKESTTTDDITVLEDEDTSNAASDDDQQNRSIVSEHTSCGNGSEQDEKSEDKECEPDIASVVEELPDQSIKPKSEESSANFTKEGKESDDDMEITHPKETPDSVQEQESNEIALTDLLLKDSDESGDDDDDSNKINKNKKPKLLKEKATSENEDALQSLLNSDSDVSDLELNDKAQKKSSLKKSVSSDVSTKVKECKVVVDKLDSTTEENLQEDGFIDISVYEELLTRRQQERDSESEFSSIMRFKAIKSASDKLETESVHSDASAEETEEDKEGETEAETSPRKEEECATINSKKEKKEGLVDIDLKEEEEDNEDEAEDDVDETDAPKKADDKKVSDSERNDEIKKALLMSSDEDTDDEEDDAPEIDDESENENMDKKRREKYEKKKQKEKDKGEKKSDDDDDDSAESENEVGSKRKRKGISSAPITLSSSEEEDEEDKEEDERQLHRKKRLFFDSDSDFESDDGRKILQSTDDSDAGESEEEKPKPKRKRIRRASTSSEDEQGSGNDKESSSPSKKKRRHIIRDEDLVQTTKNATQQEQDRRQRVLDRQKKYNKIFEVDVESDQTAVDKVVLDFDPDSKKELVSVDKKIIESLKPHQIKGIKFMYDATIESLESLDEGQKGSGCILAHCMGLGKTLQVVSFAHTLLNSKKMIGFVERILVCCPVNTVYNWVAEFKCWLKGKLLTFDVVELISAKDLWHRAYRLDDWYKEGGICIIGYDMFRNLSNEKHKKYKGKMKEIFQRTLVDPGPDMMVCDEGHVLKNEKTALSISINRVKTARRIILTGTPLQNNLKEYHCMIQFVKPNLLGNRKEFLNRFVNPIEAGQCVDALPRDVRRMKRRAHILHNLLEGCVQRFDYTVLKPFLPGKYEYVLSIQMSPIQCKLYRYYLENLAQGGPKHSGSGLFVDFHNLSKIWTHPRVLELSMRRKMVEGEDEDEMEGFICDDSESSCDSSDEDGQQKKKKTDKEDEESSSEATADAEAEAEANPETNIVGLSASGKVKFDWWKHVLEEGQDDDFDEEKMLNNYELGGKLVLLFDILNNCQTFGDKVLLFSQSILALDMIEDFLAMIDEGVYEIGEKFRKLALHFKYWRNGKDYLRLDGSTSADVRKDQCRKFNDMKNERCRLFLISTRAGGIGINLIGANRVIIFDSSWNPSHDTQSMFRVYRFGQNKPCYIYRFIAQGTMEEKIYSRQVTKISTALRVVDEHQIKRYFNMAELSELYEFTPANVEERETPNVPEDRLLRQMLLDHKAWIVNFHEHDSLLENQTEEELTEEERKAAWDDFENEKKGLNTQMGQQFAGLPEGSMTGSSIAGTAFNPEIFLRNIQAQHPNASKEFLEENLILATQQVQKIHYAQYQKLENLVFALNSGIMTPEVQLQLPFANPMDALPALRRQIMVLKQSIQDENRLINKLNQSSRPNPSKSSLISAGIIPGQPPPTARSSNTSDYVSRSYAPPPVRTTAPDAALKDFRIKLPFKDPRPTDISNEDSEEPAPSEIVTLE